MSLPPRGLTGFIRSLAAVLPQRRKICWGIIGPARSPTSSMDRAMPMCERLFPFVSPTNRPVGWQVWGPTATRERVMFAGLRGMGNGRPPAQRVRAVLDVLDDVRRNYPVDPDRTYLSGYSGGADIACTTAFALPEYFGGVISLGHAPQLPSTPWQTEFVARRLSLAIINGTGDPAMPLVDLLYEPWWRGVGTRVSAVSVRGLGHSLPKPEPVFHAYQWLEAGLPTRREAAAKFPSMRIAEPLSRENFSAMRLADAEQMLTSKHAEQIAEGLVQLEGLATRWPDTPAASKAAALLKEYEERSPKPWQHVRQEQQFNNIRLQAEGYQRLASDNHRSLRNSRSQYAGLAIQFWKQLRSQATDPQLRSEADEQLAALEDVLAEAPAESRYVSLDRVRFEMSGDVTLAEGIGYLQQSLGTIGYRLQVDRAELEAADVAFDQVHRPRIKAGTLRDIERQFLRPAGLRMEQSPGVVTLVPRERE